MAIQPGLSWTWSEFKYQTLTLIISFFFTNATKEIKYIRRILFRMVEMSVSEIGNFPFKCDHFIFSKSVNMRKAKAKYIAIH